MDIIPVIFGGAILLFGRTLYWLFVGVVGYFLGFELASTFLAGEQGLITLVAVIAGIIGIALAAVARYMAVGLAGFIVGGYFFNQVTSAFEFSAGEYAWLIFVAGGVFGVMLVMFLSEWALILLSTFAGASLVLNELPVEESLRLWVFLGLAVLGIIIQGIFLWTRKPEKKELPG